MKEHWELSENTGIVLCIIAIVFTIGVNLVIHVGDPTIAQAIAHAIRETCHVVPNTVPSPRM